VLELLTPTSAQKRYSTPFSNLMTMRMCKTASDRECYQDQILKSVMEVMGKNILMPVG